MVVNLLRDTKRCRLTSDSKLGDYFAELSDDVKHFSVGTIKTFSFGALVP